MRVTSPRLCPLLAANLVAHERRYWPAAQGWCLVQAREARATPHRTGRRADRDLLEESWSVYTGEGGQPVTCDGLARLEGAS